MRANTVLNVFDRRLIIVFQLLFVLNHFNCVNLFLAGLETRKQLVKHIEKNRPAFDSKQT